MYALNIHICGDIYPCTQPELHIYIYIYIYIYNIYIYIYMYICMQRETLKHHAKATGAAGSCSKHGITIQKSPPDATIGFH